MRATRPEVATLLRHALPVLLAVILAALAAPSFAQATDTPAQAAATEDGPKSVPLGSEAARIADLIAKLEDQRADLAKKRDEAKEQSEDRSLDALLLEARIRDLGPRPTGDAVESPLVEEERLALERELRQLEEPRLKVREDYLRYELQVERLDERIWNLKRASTFARAATPLNPANWVRFFGQSATKLTAVGPVLQASGTPGALTGLAILIGGLAATFFGQRAWLRFIRRRIEKPGTEVSRIGSSIARDFVLLGILLVGFVVSSLVGSGVATSGSLVYYLALGALAIGLPGILGYWLGQSLFAPDTASIRDLGIDDRGARIALVTVTTLGAVIGLESGLESLEKSYPYTSGANAIAPFILILVMAWLLYRLGKTLVRHRKAPSPSAEEVEESAEAASQRLQFIPVLSKAMMVAGIVAIVTGALGYIELSRGILIPTIETLMILAFMVLTFRRIAQLTDGLADRLNPESPRHHPVAHFTIAVVLALVALPIISIFWGIRPAQILDFLLVLRDGIQIGETNISFETVVIFFGVFIVGYVLTHWIQRILQYALFSQLGMDEGTRSALVTGTGYVGLLLSLLAAIAAAGIDLSSLAIVFGALSVGIGFGLQAVVSNFVSGIILLVERPIKKGDWIVVGDVSGVVEKIAVRATRIKAFDRDDVIIPNSELIAGIVRNKTFGDVSGRVELVIGIAYEADVPTAIALAKEVADAHPQVLHDPAPSVAITELGASSLALRVFSYIENVREMGAVRSDLYIEVLKRFGEAGIEIPFPQHEIRFRPDSKAQVHLDKGE